MMTKDLPGERMMLKSHDGQDLDDNTRRAILTNRPQTHGGRNRILMVNNHNPVKLLNSKAGHGMFDGLPPLKPNQLNNYAD